MVSAESYSVSQQESNDDLQKGSKNADITISFVLFFASFYSMSHKGYLIDSSLLNKMKWHNFLIIMRRNSFHDLKGNPYISCGLQLMFIVLVINAKKYIFYIFFHSIRKVSMYHRNNNTICILILVDILLFDTFYHIPLISKMSTSL